MRAIRFISGSEVAPGDVARPIPAAGEILVEVHAAGITRAELSWYPTSHTKDGGPRTGAVPGHEFAGTVAAVGAGVGSFEIGKAVFGMNDWFADGAMAEYCAAPFQAVAPKPVTLTYVEAAAVPISALTAWQGLFDRANLQRGETVLIHGAAGAVGTFAVQLARTRGAHIIATASAGNREFVASLGADQVIDYRASRFDELVHGVNVVFDTVGGETLERSWNILADGGRVVTIASDAEQSADSRVKSAFFIMEPNQKQLIEIARVMDAGEVRAIVDSTVPLERAPEAYAGSTARSGRGKIVVEIRSDSDAR